MIIENLDALKTWLSETLEPICDADPSALAKYVVALVKKDKSEKELKALCIDQLDVFLQKETQPFVDKLFEAIDNKNYLPQPEQPSTLIKVEKDEQKKDETNREDDREKKVPRRVNHSPPQSSSRYSRDISSRRGDDRKRDDRSRKREYDRSRTRSKSRERDSGKLKLDLAPVRPEGGDGYTPAALVPTATTSHFPVPTLSSTITVIAPTHHHSNNTTESWSDFRPGPPVDRVLFNRGPPPQQRKRCRDYDGVDTPPPPGLPPPPPLMNPPPVNLRPPVPPPGSLPPSLPPVAARSEQEKKEKRTEGTYLVNS
ncbi:RNA-binding protein 26 [Dissostichus eleginoides]|uniref:RNA-binding protein 26 n=1 Tax=Dissostichus eleginoides TaxID=100907 RepID=A0AAD9BZ68_DISEL|nr:RNA-binding protein 26 [Dissostichus eleginoides]